MKNTHKFIFIAIITVLLLGITFQPAEALTIEELRAKIAELQAQITQLQQQLAQMEGQPAVWCYDFNRNLKFGNSGSEIKALQTALAKEGFFEKEVISPFNFDEYTASAVVGFQEKYKDEILTPLGLKYGTGYVGNATRAKLNKLYSCAIAQPSITVLSPNGGEVWKVGETRRISWSSAGVKNVRIYIVDTSGTITGSGSTNYIYDGVIPASTGYYDWTIQQKQLPGGTMGFPRQYKIRIEQYCPELWEEGCPFVSGSKVASDSSDNSFTIVAAGTILPITIEPSSLRANATVGSQFSQVFVASGSFSSLRWSISNGTLPPGLALSIFGAFSAQISGTPTTVGTYAFTLRATDTQNTSSFAEASVTIIVTQPSITVLSPNGGEQWVTGNSYDITWSSQGIDEITIFLADFREDSITWRRISPNLPATLGKYSWMVASCHGSVCNFTSGDKYKVKISESASSPSYPLLTEDDSDGYFSITSEAEKGKVSIEGGYTVSIDRGRSFIAHSFNVVNNLDTEITIEKIWLGGETSVPGVWASEDRYRTSFEKYYYYLQTPNQGYIYLTDSGEALSFEDNVGYWKYNLSKPISIPANSSFNKTQGEFIDFITKVRKGAFFSKITLQVVGITGKGFSSSDLRGKAVSEITITNPVPRPEVILLSPNGGESLTEGENFEIKWKAQNLSGEEVCSLALFREDRANGTIAKDVSCSSGTYTWKVQEPSMGYGMIQDRVLASLTGNDSYQTLTANTSEKSYKIRFYVVYNSYLVASDESDSYFSIVTPATPSITVVSPNGGEQWEINTTQTIKWNSNGYNFGYKYVLADLMNDSNHDGIFDDFVKIISLGTSILTNQFTWQIPHDIPVGDYGIRLTISKEFNVTTNIYDYSDAPFSIVASAQKKPDLIITDLQYYAPGVTTPKVGDYVGYKVTVQNQGNKEAKGPITIKAFLNDVYLRDETYSSDFTVQPGGSFIDTQYSYTKFDKVGDNKITIQVDSDNVIDESNENNNTSSKIINVAATTTPSITVLSPNGGEKWMLNSDKTIITWTPDSESPYVVAYLEKYQNNQFVTVGKVMPAAKGSIQWAGEIDRYGNYPTLIGGEGYYIRLVNTQTDATDRSDSPFTLLPVDWVRVDMKINGSDSPVAVPAGGGNVNISWISYNATNCTLYPGELGATISGLPIIGTKTVFLKENTKNYNYAVLMVCDSPYGSRSDYVGVLPNNPSITVLSPNGGEQWEINATQTIKWNSNGYNFGYKYVLADLMNDSNHDGIFDDFVKIISLGTSILTNQFTWQIPHDIPVGDYGIRLTISKEFNVTTNIYDYSDAPFSIVAAGLGLENIQTQLASVVEAVAKLMEELKKIRQ